MNPLFEPPLLQWQLLAAIANTNDFSSMEYDIKSAYAHYYKIERLARSRFQFLSDDIIEALEFSLILMESLATLEAKQQLQILQLLKEVTDSE